MSYTSNSPKDLLATADSIFTEIEQAIAQQNLDIAENRINEYSKLLQDSRFFTSTAALLFYRQKTDDALSTLQQGLTNHPFNYEIHYNTAIVYEQIGNAIESMRHYIYSVKYARNPQEQNNSMEQVNRIITILQQNHKTDLSLLKEELLQLQMILKETDSRYFPIDKNGQSLIRKVMEKDSAEEHLVNMYKSFNIGDINDQIRMFFKTEQFKGKQYANQAEFLIEAPSVIPLSLLHDSTEIDVTINGKACTLSPLVVNRYHYIRISESGQVIFKMNQPVFIGHPIKLSCNSEHPKLVLKIFIDGLSGKYIEQQGLQNLMPRTFKYFNEGFIAENCYANSEWTLPSKASINTGQYATTHRLLHPSNNYAFEKHTVLMAEYFKDSGYFTAKIDDNWRTTPTFGYYKGFDRILYQNFLGGMDSRNVIMETIEHLETFKERDCFLSISFTDLHHVPDEIEDHLMAQVNTEIDYRSKTDKKGPTSVLSKYDENKIHKYQKEIQRIDVFLGVLYDYLDKTFNKDDLIVVLHSDHGQTFLEPVDSILHESRRKIPLMIKGKGVSEDIPRMEMIESVDILPIMLKLSGIEVPSSLDGSLPLCFGGSQEKVYAFTQVLHPGQTYKAAVTDIEHTFFFESSQIVLDDLSVDLRNYKVSLINRMNGEDDSARYHNKIQFYEQFVFSHIKNYMNWDA